MNRQIFFIISVKAARVASSTDVLRIRAKSARICWSVLCGEVDTVSDLNIDKHSGTLTLTVQTKKSQTEIHADAFGLILCIAKQLRG